MATLNLEQFYRSVNRVAIPSMTNLAYGAAKSKFDSAKRDLLEEFDDSDVTQEIAEGPEAENDSGTLNGADGNLYSFIGFDKSKESPETTVENLRNLIVDKTILTKKPISVEANQKNIAYSFKVSIPKRDEILEQTRMRWENGRSWAYAIEEGISGLSHYIFHLYFRSPPSYSTAGLQKKNEIKGRSAFYTPVPYIKTFFKNFLARF